MFASIEVRDVLAWSSPSPLATDLFEAQVRRCTLPPPTLLPELLVTVRISLLVRAVEGGGRVALERLVERVRVTVVLLDDRDRRRRLLDVGGGRLPVLPRFSAPFRPRLSVLADRLVALAERSRSFVEARLRLEDRPRL